MKTIRLQAVSLLALLLPTQMSAGDVKIRVSNDANTQRQELIEVDASAVRQKMGVSDSEPLVVRNAFGQEVGYQVTHDGKLLVDVAVRPCGTAVYTVTTGQPKAPKVYVAGRYYRERVDDIAWENDRTAYRVYGPALQRSGERAFGIDVWVKNTPDLVVADRYHAELSNQRQVQALRDAGRKAESEDLKMETTYHFDHGYGCDGYKVGPTLGCGAPALLDGGKLVLPYCYESYRILDNGPLRFVVELTYPAVAVGKDQSVVEHRVISLDKGSNFNKMTVWYEGLSKVRDLAAGIVIHSEDTESVVIGKDYVQYADPTESPDGHNFQIYVACLFPEGTVETKKLLEKKPANGMVGHAVGILKNYRPGDRFTYYFGSAWSKNDVRTQREWQVRIDEALEALHTPLQVAVE